ncbi:MAG: prephenate dehydratase domain-containing protein [Flavobacteriales bacterium Tduv]
MHAGVMAIENSITGAILSNYALLSKHSLKIIEEIYIPICYQLMILPRKNLEDIPDLISHPIGFLQCIRFF